MSTKSSEWYIRGEGNQPAGPFTAEELIESLRAGRLDATTICWREGMAQWLPIGQVEPFATALHKAAQRSSTRGRPHPGGMPPVPPVPTPSTKASASPRGAAVATLFDRLGRLVDSLLAALGIKPGDNANNVRTVCLVAVPTALLALLAVVVPVLIMASASGTGSPGLDLRNLERTRDWALAQHTALSQIEQAGNMLQLEDAEAQLQRRLDSYVGKEISWQFPVQRVTREQVHLQSQWDIQRPGLSAMFGRQAYFTVNREGANGRRRPTSYHEPPDLTLTVGQQISRENAARLSSGDAVRLSATIVNAELSSQAIVIHLRDGMSTSVAQGPTRASPQRSAPPMSDEAACATCLGSCGVVVAVLLGLIVLHIAILVWVARDAKARGMDSAILWMALVMFLGLLGMIIYVFARPQGNLIQCHICHNRRLHASARCPHCVNA